MDQRLGRLTPGALSTKQPPVQPAVASSCFVKLEGSSAARPVGGGPIPLTSMSRSGRHAVKPVGVTSDAQPAQQSADGRDCSQNPRSSASQYPKKEWLHQPSVSSWTYKQACIVWHLDFKSTDAGWMVELQLESAWMQICIAVTWTRCWPYAWQCTEGSSKDAHNMDACTVMSGLGWYPLCHSKRSLQLPACAS